MSDAWVYPDVESKIWVYRASSLGSCTRSLVASRLGESAMGPHAGLRAAMDASAGLEDECIRRFGMERASSTVIWQQKRVELDIPGNGHSAEYLVRGHIDGLCQEDDTVLEIKALGKANFDKYNSGGLAALGQLGKKYIWQAAVYGHATQRKVRMVIGEKVKMASPHGDGSFDWGIGQLIVEPAVDPESLVPLTDVYDRIHTIEDWASRDELPDCDAGCREGDPYGEAHLFEPIKMGDADLEALLDEYNAAMTSIKNLTDFKDGIRDRLINEYGVGKHAAGAFSMNIVKVMSQRFDTKWLQKTMPEVYDQGLVPSESVRVNVTSSIKEKRDE